MHIGPMFMPAPEVRFSSQGAQLPASQWPLQIPTIWDENKAGGPGFVVQDRADIVAALTALQAIAGGSGSAGNIGTKLDAINTSLGTELAKLEEMRVIEANGYAGILATNVLLTAIAGYTDNIEALIAATNAAVAANGVKLDTVHTDLTGTISTKLDSIKTAIDQVKAAVQATAPTTTYVSATILIGGSTLKNAPGTLYSYACTWAISLLDNATQIWPVNLAQSFSFGVSGIPFATNLKATGVGVFVGAQVSP